jgi:peptidoglycan hydrolase-like protein with peptidoglycan-binding domain
VTELQRSLRLLGYFGGEVNGVYEGSTAAAVTRFQKATSLPGVVMPIAKAGAQKAAAPLWASPWVLGGLGAVGVVGAGALALSRRARSETGSRAELPAAIAEFNSPVGIEEPKPSTVPISGELRAPDRVATADPVTETTRLARINIVDELVQDLRNPDPAKRHKIIWELGQRGDTRAVQPMVDLLVDSDSRQRSLILSALSEIGTRTLKPLTRALAISLQDENAEVRKNAIRDLTRVYDMVTQISSLLHQASDDPDRDVQETAKWALGQLNRIRPAAGLEVPALKNAVSPPENAP